jgi:hypothetical protein
MADFDRIGDGGRKSSLEYFSFWKHLPNLHGFCINHGILGKLVWNVLWIDRLVEILIANLSKLHFGQVLHGDIQRLEHDLGDMHILTLKIKEDTEFQKGISVKLNPGKFSCLQTKLISSVCTLEINTY